MTISRDLLIFILINLLIILAFVIFIRSPLYNEAKILSEENFWAFIAFISAFKLLGTIYPPIPGSSVTIGAVPLVGWETAFAIDFVMSNVGGVINYLIARSNGERFIKKFIGQGILNQIHKIKIKEGKEIEGLIMIRIMIGAVAMEAIHYAAGLLKINFWKYLYAMVVSHAMMGIPIYYLIELLIETRSIFLIMFVPIVLLPFLYKFRKRYLDL